MGAIEDQNALDTIRVREAAFGWAVVQTDLSAGVIRVVLEMPKTGESPVPG